MENEEIQMEIPEEQSPVQEEKPKYKPRPAFQVWGARIGLVIMIIAIILYYIHIATGGLK